MRKGAEIAAKGVDHLLTKAKSPDGRPGFVHTLAHDGTVLDPRRDTYDHAFVLLALANVYALDRGAQVRSEIDSLVAFRETELRSPHGGCVEGWPASMPRRQNPQMHLFEAMMRPMTRRSNISPAGSSRCSLQAFTTSKNIFLANISKTTGRRSSRSASNPPPGGMGLAAEGFRANYWLPDAKAPRRAACVGAELSRRGKRLADR
jgi:N-acylglucosamine 2-epimerase (GlcNAc 2-epimerase)